MGKIVETKIDRFDGGISNDSRNPAENIARVVSNFDILTNPWKLIAYRSSESGDNNGSTSTKRNFSVALFNPNTNPDTYALYGYGVVSGTNRPEILYKLLTTSGTTDMADNTWTNTANYQGAVGTVANFNLFIFYRKTGYIYGANASNIWRYDPDGTDVFADSHRALTFTHIGQGIVHSKDDILYIPYYDEATPTSAIARNNNGTWNNTALTLPSYYIPTSICEYGNFLAIACAHADGVSNSRVFLWDRNESTTTLAESIDWGTGSLIILEELEGELVGISQKGGAASSFGGIPQASVSHGDKVIFRKLVGNQAVKFMELSANHSSGANTTQIPLYKQKVDNRLYFQMLIELNGTVRDGIWSIGRSSYGAPFVLIHERTSNNNTALATGDSLRGFYRIGDYIFQSYSASSVHATTKTNDRNDSAPYNHNSVYETKRFDGRKWGFDASYYKDLVEVTLTTDYTPSTGSPQATLQYRTDNNTSWTTTFTNSTAASISRTSINIASSGAALPTDYKEIEFRIVVTGGASSGDGVNITGLIFKELIKDRRYNTA